MTSGARAERFPFRFTAAHRVAARAFGVTPANAFAELSAGELLVRYGPWRVRTGVANVRSVTVAGPFWFVKTAGPARLALTDRGLTFASNHDRGVTIRFWTPVGGIEPTGLLRHPELTVTVAEPDRFAIRLHELTFGARPSGGW